MRTGTPVCGGSGGISVAGSPTNDLMMKATGMPNDVEAAIAMVGLSGAFGSNGMPSGPSVSFESVKVEPTDCDDVYNRAAEHQLERSVKSYEPNAPRSVHLKCPVMPERHRLVQRALKRKIENRMEPFSTSDKLSTPDEHESFIIAKQCRLQATVDQSQQQIGRFVRTSQPCHPNDALRSLPREIEPQQPTFGRFVLSRNHHPLDSSKESGPPPREVEQNVGRFVRTGQPCRSIGSSQVWKSVEPNLIRENVNFRERGNTESIPVLKTSSYGGAMLFNSLDSERVGNQLHHTEKVGNFAITPSKSFSSSTRQSSEWLSQMHKVYRGQNVQQFPKSVTDFTTVQNGLSSGGSVTSNASKESLQLEKSERAAYSRGMKQLQFNQQSKSNDSLSALYNLGRNAASSFYLPSRRRDEFAPISDFVNASIEQHKFYLPTKQRLCSGPSQNFRLQHSRRNENFPAQSMQVRSLDIRTEQKVTSGEFASLHSLKMFYSRIENKSSVSRSAASRHPLTAITNQFSRSNEDRVDSWQCNSGNEETALDLSMHSNRISTALADSASARLSRPSTCGMMRRRSRSCCNSPVPNVTMLKRRTRETSTEYINRLLLLESESDEFPADQSRNSSPLVSRHSPVQNEIDDDASSPKSSPYKPDNTLPLKKRRLIEVDISDSESSSPGANSMNFKEETIAHQQSPDVKLRSRCIASTMVQPDEDGDLPLHIAVTHRNTTIVTELVKMMSQVGASLDIYNNMKQTALHRAVITDQPEIVRLLLSAGASPNVVDHNGWSSVHHAANQRSASCLQCIVDHSTVSPNVNNINCHGLSALHLAVKVGNLPAVATLLEAGAYVDVRDRTSGRTPLFYAVEHNDVEMATLLLQHSADPRAMTYSNSSAAAIASNARCNTEVVRLLNAYAPADGHRVGSILPTACLG